MSDLKVSDFAKGYVDCALWLARGPEGVDASLDYMAHWELEESILAQLVADADAFRASAAPLLDKANDLGRDDAHLGHDFFLSRNRHGTGFWDRGLGDVGNALHAMATPYGERSLEVDEEGNIWLA